MDRPPGWQRLRHDTGQTQECMANPSKFGDLRCHPRPSQSFGVTSALVGQGIVSWDNDECWRDFRDVIGV
ncbi:hypothetical protein GCM10027278_17350 [Paralcaligenes ginsengisoli]